MHALTILAASITTQMLALIGVRACRGLYRWKNFGMAFEPSPAARPMRAISLANWPTPYLLKGADDDDSSWNLVEQVPIASFVPGLPEGVTVKFADGDVRLFEPNDQVLVGDVTNRLGGDRQEIREVAEANEWQRVDDPSRHRDVFSRGMFKVEVHYEDDTALWADRFRGTTQIAGVPSGSGKVAAIEWMKSAEPDEV
jgi:hypothetical protein